MVSKSPNWGCSPSKWPEWLINGGYQLLTNWDDPPSWMGFHKPQKSMGISLDFSGGRPHRKKRGGNRVETFAFALPETTLGPQNHEK